MLHFGPTNWKRMLANVADSVDEELHLRNEYLVTENRILRGQIKGRARLTDPERVSLAEIGKRLGRKPSKKWPKSSAPKPSLAGTGN